MIGVSSSEWGGEWKLPPQAKHPSFPTKKERGGEREREREKEKGEKEEGGREGEKNT